MEKKVRRRIFNSFEPMRKARNSKRPRIKYSMICPDFRIAVWIISILSGDIEGARKRSRGSIIREVFCAENVPVDAQKIKPIQMSTGTQ
jgi:hypothetical protein